MLVPCLKSQFGLVLTIIKVEIFLEQREVALSPSKICENLNFSTFKFSQILLGNKNATYLCSKIISTLP